MRVDIIFEGVEPTLGSAELAQALHLIANYSSLGWADGSVPGNFSWIAYSEEMLEYNRLRQEAIDSLEDQ